MDTLRWAVRSLVHPDLDEVATVYQLLRPRGPGVMVDVGAHHGASLERFADDGWIVHAVEPDPANRKVLSSRTHGMQNVVIEGRAIGPKDGQTVTLYTSPVSSGISTLRPFDPSHQATTQVTTVRLETYLADTPAVTFLKVDAEGQDLPVLQTFPWNRLHPQAVVCEFEDSKTTGIGYTHHDLARYLVERGYEVLLSEWFPVVRYGAHHRWRSLRRYPAELQDLHAWGNLIAVDPPLLPTVQRLATWRSRSSAFLTKVRHRAMRALSRDRRS